MDELNYKDKNIILKIYFNVEKCCFMIHQNHYVLHNLFFNYIDHKIKFFLIKQRCFNFCFELAVKR